MKTFPLRATLPVLIALLLSAPAAAAIKNAPLHKYFRAGVVNLRIDKIETYPSSATTSVPVLEGQGFSGPGYVVITATEQNPSGNNDVGVPHMEVGFELEDGSQMSESAPDAINVPGTKILAATSLHPKQHIVVNWVLSGWTGAAPTKLFLKVWNQSGYPGHWFRIQLKPTDVTAHT